VKLFEGTGEGGCEVGSRFAVQPLCLNSPGTGGRVPERAFQIASDLGVIRGLFRPAASLMCDSQPLESDVAHDHIRLRQHQIGAVARIRVRRARHVKHASTTECGETVGGSSCGGELSSRGGAPEMISDGCTNASCKVLVKGVGVSSQACGRVRIFAS
jgi:hypothetical protein